MICVIVLYFILQLHVVSAAYSPAVAGRKISELDAPLITETSTGFATDWQFCRQKCLENATCLIFVWKSATRGCALYPIWFEFSGVVWFYGVFNNVMGRLDRSNGSLMWLSLGTPTFPMPVAIRDLSAQECRNACDANTRALPCSAIELRILTNYEECELHAGYFDDFAKHGLEDVNTIKYNSTSIRYNSTDPTGNGTLILAGRLPAPPPNVTVPPFNFTNITASKLSAIAGLKVQWSNNMYKTLSDCAIACHNFPKCQSFIQGDGHCNGFDVALRGTIAVGYSYYGIIDRNSAAGTLKYLVPSFFQLRPTALAEYASVMTEEDCAAKCYQFHQPIYCTSFQLDSSSHTCYLLAVELDGWTPSSKTLPTASSFSYGIIEGRKPYNHHYDAGFPANQLITTTTTSTTTTPSTTTTTTAELIQEPPTAATYRVNKESCRLGAVAKIELMIPITKMSPGLFCAHNCFSRRQWCRGYEVNAIGRICQLFDIAVDDPVTQLSQNDVDCSYGQPAK